MSDFFKCDCVRTWRDAAKWCNRTAHDEFMDDVDHDGCDGHHQGEEVHCTDFCVFDGDVVKCTLCNYTWVHSDEDD